MNATAEIIEPVEETNIALLVETDPSIVIREPKKLAALYKRIDADIASQVPDLTSDKGRKAIASLAFKIARTKTAVEGAAKKMTEEFRKATAEVNSTRNAIVEALEAKQKQARKPLTEWEAAEDERLAAVKDEMTRLRSAGIVAQHETSGDIAARIADLEAETFDSAVFRDELDEADRLKQMALVALGEAHSRALTQEAEKAELERLRKADEERRRREAERQAAEVAARRQKEAAEAEQKRIADAAEKARLDAIAETERKAAADRKALEDAHQAELAGLQKEKDEADRARQAEADRIAKQKAADEAEAKRKADEEAKRAANVAHRARVKGAAKKAIVALGADEDLAVKIVQAIVAGEVPAVSMRF